MATFHWSTRSCSAYFSSIKCRSRWSRCIYRRITTVDEYTIGLTYKITPKWLVSADFNYHGWERYSKLTLDFENAQVGNQADKTVLVSPKNFKNAKTFRIGTQYMLTDKLAGRLGYYFDESPYEDKYFIPETPSLMQAYLLLVLDINLES